MTSLDLLSAAGTIYWDSFRSKRSFLVSEGIAVGYLPLKQASQQFPPPISSPSLDSGRYPSESAPIMSDISSGVWLQAIRFSFESISVP